MTDDNYPQEDIDLMEPRLFELYSLWCETNGLSPTIKGYFLYLEERY